MLLILAVVCCYIVLSSHAERLAVVLGHAVVWYRCGTAVLLCCFLIPFWNRSGNWRAVDNQLLEAGLIRRLAKLGGSRSFATVPTGLALVLVTGGLLWHWHSVFGWRMPPPWDADMFPTIQRGVASFFAGRDPYLRGYWFSAPFPGVAPWQNHMVFLPGLWLPFALADAFGMSYMWVSLASTLVVLGIFVLVALDGWRNSGLVDVKGSGDGSGRVVVFSLYAVGLGGLFFLKQVAAIMHTSPLWSYLALFCYFALSARTDAASGLLGVLCASRPSAVVLVPIWIFLLLRTERRRLGRHAIFFLAPIIVLVLPFFIWNPREFIFSTISWYGISSASVWRLRPDWVTESFGLTGVLFSLGLGGLRLGIQIVLQLGVYLLAWRHARSTSECLQFMALALLLFYMTVPVPYGYIYAECILLFSFAALADARAFFQLARGL